MGLLLAGTAMVAACTSGEVSESTASAARSSGNRPPVVTSAVLINTPISQDAPVAVQIQSEDPEREAVSFYYQWYVNDTPIVEQTNSTLPPDFFSRGETVFVEIIPTDGTNKGQPYRTASAVVGNTPPRISGISLMPRTPRAGDRLEAQVEASDPDHDRIDLVFKWYRNDTVIKEGEDSFLDTTGLAAPDRVTVEVRASDPAGSASSSKSEPLILGNSGPKIVSIPPTSAVQGRFDYSVKALDPDGDLLTYHLEMAPPGMSIGSESGQLSWRVPSDQQGTFHVRVVAKDGRGGLATQEFDLTLMPKTSSSIPPGA